MDIHLSMQISMSLTLKNGYYFSKIGISYVCSGLYISCLGLGLIMLDFSVIALISTVFMLHFMENFDIMF